MLTLAFRNILRQHGRTWLTLAAIVLGVASLIFSGGFVEDVLKQLRETTIRSELGHLQIYKQGQYASGGHNPLKYLIEDGDTDIANQLATQPGVATYARRIRFAGLMSNERAELPIVGEGVEPEPEARIGSAFTILSGRQLAASDHFGMVIGEGLANSMKLKVGDSANIVLSTREGATNALEFQIVGIFRSLSKEYDARAVRISLQAALELTAVSSVNAFVVLLQRTEDTEKIREQLERRLPPRLEVKAWYELADFYKNTAALYEREFGFLQVIIVVMIFLSVANSINMTFHERIPEFGIIRALGRTGRNVFGLAMLEATLLGMLGAAVGVVVGVVVALLVSAIGIPMAPPPNSESGFTASVQVVPSVLAVAFVLGLLASVCAALLPARYLGRMSLVDALRRGI
jgi:putative ABC transport system permease protein